MLTTEKAFDMLPSFVDIYDKLDGDSYRKKIAEEGKGKKLDETTVGINMFKYVLKNSGKVKQEIFEIVAVFEEKTIEEVKTQNFLITVKSFRDILSDKEVMGFFKNAMR